RRVGHHSQMRQARRDPEAGLAAYPPPHLRDASARGGCGLEGGAGNAGPRRSVYHAALYACGPGLPANRPQELSSQGMIFVLDNYDSFTYNLVQYLGELGAEPYVRRNDELSLAEI